MNHFSIPRKKVNRIDFLTSFCKNKSVLHIGCADSPYTEESIISGRWLHSTITKVSKQCLGVDLDGSAIKTIRDKYQIDNIIQGNAESLSELSIGQYDVVLAGEIIEHLNNPGLFLGSAKDVLKPDGKLVITTTNAFCLRRFLRIPFSVESVHPDHTYYFSHTVLKNLASRFEYRLVEAYSYQIQNKKPLLPYLIESLGVLITPNWSEGIIHVYSTK